MLLILFPVQNHLTRPFYTFLMKYVEQLLLFLLCDGIACSDLVLVDGVWELLVVVHVLCKEAKLKTGCVCHCHWL